PLSTARRLLLLLLASVAAQAAVLSGLPRSDRPKAEAASPFEARAAQRAGIVEFAARDAAAVVLRLVPDVEDCG
ncbi:MAG: hypothetical protein ACREFQ_13765, partial [Stellaceae bacterium]